jgi:hypothetical protein
VLKVHRAKSEKARLKQGQSTMGTDVGSYFLALKFERTHVRCYEFRSCSGRTLNESPDFTQASETPEPITATEQSVPGP